MQQNNQLMNDLERLAQLKAKGVITLQEYQIEKQQILDKLNAPDAHAADPAHTKSETTPKVDHSNNVTQPKQTHRAWYTHGWGLICAILLLPYFALYYVLTRNDDSDKWYKSGWGAAIAVIFAPLFALYYIWAKKTEWSVLKRGLVSAPLALLIVVFTAAAASGSPPEPVSNEAPKPVAATDTKEAETPESLYAVTKIVDGDTIEVRINGKDEGIRLIGVDTHETVDLRKPVQCFGKEASQKITEILKGKKFRLEADPTQSERDKFNRLLRYVYLEDGTLLNKQLIAEGYAHEYTFETPYKFQAEFKQVETEARNAGKGLWSPSTCNGTTEAAEPTPTPNPTLAPTPAPPQPAPSTGTDTYYSDCAAVREAGKAPIHKGQPGYRTGLDRDGDGIACDT